MGRMIDASVLQEEYKRQHDGKRLLLIDVAPTVDAVPVIRCKDCKWGQKVSGNIECFADRNVPPEYHGYEWYCPNGERKKDDEHYEP